MIKFDRKKLEEISKEVVKSIESEGGYFEVVATKQIEDREGDIVVIDGIDLKNYLKNPVILINHDWGNVESIVGIAKEVKKQGDQLIIKGVFSKTNPKAQLIRAMYEEGVLRAVSIGFIPKEFEGNKITKSELLEMSFVTIPANPEALVVNSEKGAKEQKVKFMTLTIKELKEVEEKKEEEWVVGGNPNLPISEQDQWDGAKAKEEIRKWASTDGSGEKDKIDWKRYKEAFVFYNKKDPKNFESYKFPFCRVIDGKLVATWGGVKTAMAYLLGARGGTNLPDDVRKRGYEFLAGYYKKFDKEPPEFHIEDGEEQKDQAKTDIEKRLGNEIVELKEEIKFIKEMLKELADGKAKAEKEKEFEIKEMLQAINRASSEALRKIKEKKLI